MCSILQAGFKIYLQSASSCREKLLGYTSSSCSTIQIIL